ncbi:hypothetical protein F5X96DRAFT_619896 [Biscogniauxia mediterranea]|nr:hypothetical protein F5X96DRAFT_619896 [Biscogniauxia mediterranea]
MDPLSAFSLAAGVVQFADFAGRLLADTVQVYRSTTGQSSTTIELSRIAQDLRYYTDHINRKANSLGPIPENDTSLRISKICTECGEVCTELEKALEKLQATGETKLEVAQSSLKVTLRGLWMKDEVDALARKLSKIRSTMMDVITISMWENGQQGWANVHQLVGQQDKMLAMLSRIDKTTTDFRQEFIDMTNDDNTILPQNSTQQTVVWAKICSPRSNYQADVSLDKDDPDLCKSILDSLVFQSLTHREKAISEAYEQTFRWVFEDPRVDQQGKAMWSNFPAWLQGDSDSMYWVAGKPGSGKSTLMKYIINNELLKTHLRTWAGSSRKLLLGGFYFWNSGTAEQKSHAGLLKTLLFECLSNMPELVPRVNPKRWAFRKIFNDPQEPTNPPWSLAELQETFTLLASGAGESYAVALFIDGLDEFSGDHQQLLDFLSAIHRHGRGWVRICVSSRPWNVFLDSFRNSPQLRLEDLTRLDIEHYVRSNLESHAGFEELRAAYEAESEDLIQSIVHKAHGVFLWIFIVVRSLLGTLTDGSSIPELQALIDELPESLSDLYLRIFQSIPSKYIQEFSRFLQIKEALSYSDLGRNPDVESLWLAEHTDALSINMSRLTSQQKAYIYDSMRRKVGSRTKGLLEVSSVGEINYLHRTTRDWVVKNWSDITARGPEDFDVYVTLLKTQAILSNDVYYSRESPLHPTDILCMKMIDCVRYASQISRYDQHRELVHRIVKKLVDGYDTFYQSLSRDTQCPDKSSQKATQRRNYILLIEDNVASLPNADVIIAAQLCIVDYVREKVALDPSILNQESKRPSILESAIVGIACMFYGKTTLEAPTWDITVSQQRVALVRFLLDSGANPTQHIVQGLHIIDHVKRLKFQAPFFHLDRHSYWDAVEALLESAKYSAQRRDVSPPSRPEKATSRHRFSRRMKKWLKAHD